jgi:ADP-ribose pyrophosphatase YjhB (NUDIX family)
MTVVAPFQHADLIQSRALGHKVALDCRALITDRLGRVLLTKCQDIGEEVVWTMPGGTVAEKETCALAVTRRLHEELGVLIWPHCIISVLETMDRQSGDYRFSIAYAASIISGQPSITSSGRIEEARWFAANQLPDELATEASDALRSRQAIHFQVR